MSGPAVTVVDSGGLPVKSVASGAPVMTVVESGGMAVTLSEQGAPFILEGLGGGGTSPDRYSFIGTGLRVATGPVTVSGNNYRAFDMQVGMPPWEVDEFYVFFPFRWWAVTAGEVAGTSPLLHIEGAAVWNAAGTTRVPALIDGGTAPVVIDPTVPATQYGKWVKVTPAVPIAANALARISFAQYIADGTIPIGGRGLNTTTERGQGAATSMLSTLSGGAAYSNANGFSVRPIAMMAKGGDGRPAVFAFGDSIGYGQDGGASPAYLSARYEFGFLGLGLDDQATTQRLPFFNMCIPGWGPSKHANPATCARQLWMISKAREINNGEPLADVIISQHGTNDVSSGATQLKTYLRDSIAVMRAAVGSEDTPVMQVEMLPLPTSSSDGYATTTNQVIGAVNAYPAGARWLVNEAIGGPDGLGSPTAELRADGTIQSSIAPWRISGSNTGSGRDKLSVLPFSTTLAAAWNSGTTPSLTAAPDVGDYPSFVDGATIEYGTVTSVSGAGPYTVGVTLSTSPLTALPSGAAVRNTWHGVGLHPGPNAHLAYSAAVVAWKLDQGWVPS